MLSALRIPAFRRLWTGGTVSAIGDMVLLIALPFHVYNLTGSTLAVGTTFLAQTLPRLLLGSFAGVYADRWDHRRTMIAVDLARALILVPLLLVRSAEWVWLVYAVTFSKAILTQFFGPAYNALLPRLVGRDSLVAANSATSVSDSIVRLAAPTLGGALLAFSGITFVVVLDVASYLVSALFLWSIVSPGKASAPAARRTAGGVLEAWLGGFRLLATNRFLGRLLLVSAVAMVAQGIVNVLLVPFVKEMLGGSALVFGWLATAQGVGALVGGLVMGRLGIRAATLTVIGTSLATVGALFFCMVSYPQLHLALGLLAVIGLPSSFFAIGVQTLFQTHTSDETRGRMFGLYGSVSVAMMMLGMGIASWLGEVSLRWTLNLAAATFLLAGALGLAIGLRTFRRSLAPLERQNP